jgi:hypothetical protein
MRLTCVLGEKDLRANAVLMGFFCFAGIFGPALAARAGMFPPVAARWILIAFGVTTIPVMAGFWCVGAEKMFGTMRVLAGLAVERSAIVWAKHLEALIFSGGFLAFGALVFALLHIDTPADLWALLAIGIPSAIAGGAVSAALNFACPPQAALVMSLLVSLIAAAPLGLWLVASYHNAPLITTVALVGTSAALCTACIAISSLTWGHRDDVCR